MLIKTISKTKVVASRPKPRNKPVKKLRRGTFKPRYDQIAAFHDKTIEKVEAKLNEWLKDFAITQKEKGDRCGRFSAQVLPIYSTRPNSFVGQIIYSLEI